MAEQNVDFTQLVPTEYRADATLVIGDPPRLGVIVEVQRSIEASKTRTWPLYAHALYARLDCPVELVVVTLNPAVERWASRPLQTSTRQTWTPLVIGPKQIPRTLTQEQVVAAPELGVLVMMAHGGERETDDEIGALARTTLAGQGNRIILAAWRCGAP